MFLREMKPIIEIDSFLSHPSRPGHINSIQLDSYNPPSQTLRDSQMNL